MFSLIFLMKLVHLKTLKSKVEYKQNIDQGKLSLISVKHIGVGY